jgi:ribosomal protein S18 acetylase RimI-like enzyme
MQGAEQGQPLYGLGVRVWVRPHLEKIPRAFRPNYIASRSIANRPELEADNRQVIRLTDSLDQTRSIDGWLVLHLGTPSALAFSTIPGAVTVRAPPSLALWKEWRAAVVRLRPMTDQEFETFIERLLPDYAQEHVRAGSFPEAEALDRARQQVNELVPDGVRTKDQYLYVIEDEAGENAVGILWFARQDRGAGPTAFVYDIEIHDQFRRRGYASQAFRLLEDRVRELGLSTISLHVFGSNTAAREMYRKLGYEETHIEMSKTIPSEPSAG